MLKAWEAFVAMRVDISWLHGTEESGFWSPVLKWNDSFNLLPVWSSSAEVNTSGLKCIENNIFYLFHLALFP